MNPTHLRRPATFHFSVSLALAVLLRRSSGIP